MPDGVCAGLLYREGLHLDRQEWDAWLDLYAEDGVFWIPAWLDEHRPTSDPDREVSLIYHDSRAGLRERVMRIRSRKSVTALPLPRTVHMVTNILPGTVTETTIEATSSWTVHDYDPRAARQHLYVGRYEHSFRQEAGGAWRIAREKVLLATDMIPTSLDFHSVRYRRAFVLTCSALAAPKGSFAAKRRPKQCFGPLWTPSIGAPPGAPDPAFRLAVARGGAMKKHLPGSASGRRPRRGAWPLGETPAPHSAAALKRKTRVRVPGRGRIPSPSPWDIPNAQNKATAV